jgi:hypothetical protein
MSKSTSTNSNEVGLGTVLTLIFVVLKLTGNIAWSWWWVLSPLWIGGAFILVLLVVLGVIAAAMVAGK